MSKLLEVSDDNFEQEIIESEIPALVDFGAEWCDPCRKLHPIIEEIAAEMAGKIKVVSIDVGKSPHLAQRFAVMSVPRLILFKAGKPVDTIIGFIPKDKIKKMVKKHL